jgi:hypothetical protein
VQWDFADRWGEIQLSMPVTGEEEGIEEASDEE